jgi:hypothetical protein
LLYRRAGSRHASAFGTVRDKNKSPIPRGMCGMGDFVSLDFMRLLLLTRTQPTSTPSSCARALCGFDVHSLSSDKERTKKTSFGKPKVQVCLFAKREHRASHGRKHCGPRGLIPLGTPECEKVAPLSLCSSFRKGKHLQLLRARLKESRAHLRARALAFPACHACWQSLRHSINNVYLISLVPPCSVARKGRSKRERLGTFSWLLL